MSPPDESHPTTRDPLQLREFDSPGGGVVSRIYVSGYPGALLVEQTQDGPVVRIENHGLEAAVELPWDLFMDGALVTLLREFPDREWNSTPFGETLPLHRRHAAYRSTICCKDGEVIATATLSYSKIWSAAIGACRSCSRQWLMLAELDEGQEWLALLPDGIELSSAEGGAFLQGLEPDLVVWIDPGGEEHVGHRLPDWTPGR